MKRYQLLLLLLVLLLFQVGNTQSDVRLVILSDFNGSYGATSYPTQVSEVLRFVIEVWQPDLLVSAGDVIAGQSTALPEQRFYDMWAAFDVNVGAPLRAAGIPYAFAMGNHDGSSQRDATGDFVFARERQAAQAYWHNAMYEANLAYQSPEDFPFNYSFVFEDVFFAVWDASSATIMVDQWDWLERELASSTANESAYRILVGHLPLYGVSELKNIAGEVLADGDAHRQRLEALGINLYISGHHGAYYPGKVGKLSLLHSGGIGAKQLIGSDVPSVSTVTVVDLVLAEPAFYLTTYNVATFNILEPSSLPPQIAGLNGVVTRLDLAP